MRKFVAIGVGKFETDDDAVLDGEEILTMDELGPLEFVDDKAIEIATALGNTGLLPAGNNPILHPTYDELQKILREARKGRATDGCVIHYIGHGLADSDLGALHLPATDTDLAMLGDTSVDLGALINAVESNQRGPQVLLLLDVCNAGEATRFQALNLLRSNRRKAWVIGASTRDEKAFKGRFSDAVVQTLRRLQDGWLDIHPSLEYVPIETIASEIDLSLNRICSNDHSALPQSLTVTPRTDLHEDSPPFFKNPTYKLTPQARLLMRAEAEVREFAEQLDEGLDAIHFATRATGAPHQTRMTGRCFFAGREAELSDLSQWMDTGLGSSLRVVTGSPGAGKSALLGVLVCLSHPDLCEATSSIASKIPTHLQPSYNEGVAAVHARSRDIHQILSSLARQLDIQVSDEGELTPAHLIEGILNGIPDPIIIVDALDEAVRPVDVMSSLLLPLSNARNAKGEPACRVLVGTRPWSQFSVLLKAAERAGGLINLDNVPTETVKKDLKQYIWELLRNQLNYRAPSQKSTALLIADSIANVLSSRDVVGGFLIAGLFVHQIGTELNDHTISQISELIPRSLPQMLELHLSQLRNQHNRWMRPVMAALAHAKGEGMPAIVIQAASAAFNPEVRSGDPLTSRPTDQEIAEVLAATSFYMRHSVDADGRTLYRLFHQALADHLLDHPIDPSHRTSDKTADALVLVREMRSLVERPDKTPSRTFKRNIWKSAPPYLLRHVIQHALDGGDVDSLLSDSEFLVHSDPNALLPLLGYAKGARARLAAAVYRTSVMRHGRVDSAVRRRILSLDASRYGAQDLLASLQAAEEINSGPAVRFVWSTGGELKDSFDHEFDGHNAAVTDVTRAAFRGNMAIVSASEDGSLRVYDARAGWTLAHVQEPHTDWILSLKSVEVNGKPILVTAGVDCTVVGWDFSSADVDSFVIGRHDDWVRVLAVHEMDERAIVVSGGDDHELKVWDLASREMIGDSLRGHGDCIYGLAIGRIGGNSIAVSSSRDGEVIVWDLSTRKILRRFIPFPDDWVRAIAMPEGHREVFLASAAGSFSIWNLSGLEEISRSLAPASSGIRHVDSAVIDGESMAVTCADNGALSMWTRQAVPIPFPFAFRGLHPYALSTSSVDGRPLALIGAKDGTVLSLNLNSDEELGVPWIREVDDDAWMFNDEKEGTLYAAVIGSANGKPIVYTGDNAGTISKWAFDRSLESDIPVYAHNHEVSKLKAVTHPTGDMLISSSAYGAIMMCELATGAPIAELSRGKGGPGRVRHFAVSRLGERVRIVVGDDELTVWDSDDPTVPSRVFPRFRASVAAVAVAEFEEVVICVSGHDGGGIRFWDFDTAELLATKSRAHENRILDVVNVGNPESMRVASISEDGLVCIWDCLASQMVAKYHLRDSRPTCIASMFNKWLNVMVVGYENGIVDFLDPFSGRMITDSIVFPFGISGIGANDNGLMVVCFSQQIAFMELDGG
jgi:WD40 repeat protein